ncbi:F-box domain-containing protein [Heracleum sosnowskyi]|uniref:F-box domain-containing protein n=1 Tax=Heracleum sosnowskyi TaxID=360622 RepID=A0AAD8JAV0_9APIA|nr:F-box domain-containing protein [Heracleum sosnowskyi]
MRLNEENRIRIINNLKDTNCPRLNKNAVVVKREYPPVYWPGIKIKSIPLKPERQPNNKLSGFFHAQLRIIRSLNKKKKKGMLSSNKSVDNLSSIASSWTSNCSKSISVDNQIIASSWTSNCSKSISNKSVDNLSIIASSSTSNCSKYKTSLINYQFSDTGRSGPILKRHRINRRRLSDLPKELLAEILVRLPVKYILRCRCVLKSWNSFIKSPVFVGLQLDYQKQLISAHHNHHYPKYLLFQNRVTFDLTLRFDRVKCEKYCILQFLPGFSVNTWFALAYGLICASTILDDDKFYNRNIYLWNPLVNKYKTIPDSPLPCKQNWKAWEALAFGFLPEVNDFVVIHIIKPCLPVHPHSVVIGVYSLNTDSWKKSSQDNVFISGISGNHDDVVFVNGAAFWVGANSNKKKTLMCFDTKTDILSEISLPDSVAYEPFVPVIHPFGQSIAYFIWKEGVIHFDMWVLKYAHMNEFTWEKKMCVTPSEDVEEEVLGVRNNGDPILAKSKHLISYNLDSHQAYGFVHSRDRWTPNCPYEEGHGPPYVIRPFVESLVMLNND